MALLEDLLDKTVTKITFETAYTPPIVINRPFQPGAAPSPVLQALKPKITLEIMSGAQKPVTIKPYGDPGPSRFPQVVAGSLLVVGLLIVGVRRL